LIVTVPVAVNVASALFLTVYVNVSLTEAPSAKFGRPNGGVYVK
jgi:hypothetical protein